MTLPFVYVELTHSKPYLILWFVYENYHKSAPSPTKDNTIFQNHSLLAKQTAFMFYDFNNRRIIAQIRVQMVRNDHCYWPRMHDICSKVEIPKYLLRPEFTAMLFYGLA